VAFRRKRDRDLDEEISSHLRMAAHDRGQEAARSEFGNVGLIKEVTREMWGFASWEALANDLRYALRVLGKNPGYALTAILSLALGIGANTAIFSLIDSIMLKSLPVHNPGELVSIGDPSAIGSVHEGDVRDVAIFSYPFYKLFREQNGVFAGVYATGRSERLHLEGSAERPLARFVSDNYFTVLGVSPVLGRTFTSAEEPVVVISHAYWERHFQGAQNVIGRNLRINGASFTVIGVTPRDFFGDIVGYQSDIWLPIEAQPLANPGRNYLNDPKTQWLLLMGRLAPGVSLARAETVTNTVGLGILKEQIHSDSSPDERNALERERIPVQTAAGGFSRIRRSFSRPLLMLMALVGLVLLICCTNVANLQLARAAVRAREIGLRLAIGASRPRLLRQLMTESLALAAAGGAAGLFIAMWAGHLLLGLVAHDNRLPLDFRLSGTTLLFTVALSVAASLFFGLAPALFATKASLVSNLKESKGGRSHSGGQRFEKGLVVFQIVLSWVLLFGSGLFIRTLQNLENSDIGYRRDQLIVVELDPVASGYQGDKLIQLGTRLLEKLASAPGIERVTISENGLFSGTESTSGLMVEGFTPRSDTDKESHSDRVGPGYFETIGTPILKGRGIEARDTESAPVAVINESMARFYFPNVSPVGRHISVDNGKSWMTIVGVVRDAKQNNLREPAARRFYSPFMLSKGDPIGSMRLELRAHGAISQAEELIRRQIGGVDSNLQIQSISAAQSLIDNDLLQERLIAKLSGSFSLLALVLASVGLYGVMSYLTQRRTTEMGIRMALGASRSNVVGMVLKETMVVTAAGLLVGIGVAAFLGKLLSASLYGVAAFDPLTAGLASVTILAAAFLAGWLPARRASHIDPMAALRME
jgi:predicted permease